MIRYDDEVEVGTVLVASVFGADVHIRNDVCLR